MKKLVFLSAVFLLLSAGEAVGYSHSACPGAPGEIWATHADGSKEDYFLPGEDVYLDGENFKPGKTYKYEVLDMDNNKVVVASGTIDTDSSGNLIRKKIWTIPTGDYYGHEYRVDLIYSYCRGMHYRKSDTFYTGVSIPEFPSLAVPVLLTLSGYLLVGIRRGRRH